MHVGSCLRVVARKRAENEPFNIQNNVSDIFDDTLGSGEFVLNALDLDSGRFRAIQGREQNATHAIAQGVSIATLKRLNNEASNEIVNLFCCNCRPHELCHTV